MKAGTTPDDGTRDKINFHLDELREQGYVYDTDTRQMVRQCEASKAVDAELLAQETANEKQSNDGEGSHLG